MIHLIHCIHTGGPSPVEGLLAYLPPGKVYYPDYGYILGIESRLVNPLIVGALLPYIAPGDTLIGHSNGAAICQELMNRGAPARSAIYINAALERNIVRPAQCGAIDVYYNAGDELTEIAALGARAGLVDTAWGEMGHAGYSGTDKLIMNFDCANMPPLPVVWGHSDFFSAGNLSVWGPFLGARVAIA